MFMLVGMRKSGGKQPFGREMADAYKRGQPLPQLVEIDLSDDDNLSKLKRLILHMTQFHSRDRVRMDRVRATLAQLLIGDHD